MKYLNYFNHYRAIAIIFIIAAHSINISDLNLDSYSNRFLVNMISGSTLNFSFISGFLFYIVLYPKYEYSSFFKARIDRFLKPYLCLSILPIIFCLILKPNYWGTTAISNTLNVTVFKDFMSTVKFLISGAHITAYWYIPFVMLMALISPLQVAFIKCSFRKQVLLFGALLFIASIVQRPYERTFVFQAFQSLVYFTPFYLFGIICAMQQEKIYEYLKGKEAILLLIITAFLIFETNSGHIGLYKNHIFTYNGIDTVIFKMIFVCLFFMVWLYRFEHVKSDMINTIANTSFAVYFLHVYVLKILFFLKSLFNLNFQGYGLFVFLITVITILTLSIVLTKFINKIFPKHSYIIIGFGKKPKTIEQKENAYNNVIS